MSTIAASRAHSSGASLWLPGPAIGFMLAFGAVFTSLNLAKGLVDPDGFWHLATGRLIVESGRVPSTDPFSFTWNGAWTTHEWLSEVLMYRLWEAFGPVGLTLVWGIFPALIFGVMVHALRRRGVSLLAIGPAVVLGAMVLVPYVTLRPQSISWLLLAILVWGLLEARPQRARWFLLAAPFFVLWANLHGLYVAGLGTLAVYAAFTVAGRTPLSPRRWWVVGAVGMALAASMLTPAGPVGILYPLRYLEAGDWGLGYIPEWNSPDFHEPAHLALLVMIVALAWNAGRSAPAWLAFLSFAAIPASLLAMRSAPLLAVFAVPVLALGLHDRLRARAPRAAVTSRGPLAARRLTELVAASMIAVVAVVSLVPRDLGRSIAAEVDRRFPVASVDLLERVEPDARVFAEYSWGGYVAYRLHDRGGSDFVDGRNDMFDQQILEDYSSIRAADPGWDESLDRYGATAILLPPDAPVTRGIATASGWCEAYRDEREVMLLRRCGS